MLKKNLTSTLKVKLQEKIFSFCVKNNLVNYLNIFFLKNFMLKKRSINSYKEMTYPLTAYGIDVKKAIFPYSFLEVQIILKKNTLPESLSEFIKKCQNLNLKGFVIGIKMHKNSNNYLSFAGDGVSININQIFTKKNEKQIFQKFHELYKFIIEKNHKIYLCKDFILKKNNFFKNYEYAKQFFSIKEKYDKNNLFSSDFLDRIKK
jgi:FAD/FMN-containing dehydrogenase